MAQANAELLRRRERAPATASKTVTAFRFEVPAGTEALTLAFDYSPRESRDAAVNRPLVEAAFERHVRRRRDALGPAGVAEHRERLNVDRMATVLNNLMNVVLIDPRGRWRGRWDRNPSSVSGELVLARACASRGFVAGAIEPGTWTAAVECHGIFGAPVDYEISVHGRPPPTEAEIAALREPPYTEPPFGETPRPTRGAGWYFGELHSHSRHSDGKMEMAEIADRAARVGLDFLAMTDHNTMSAHPVAAGAPLIIVPGFELTTFHGHHPIYGLDDMVPWHEGGRVLPLATLAPRIRAAGGIVGVAHPFVPGDPLCTGCSMVEGLPPDAFDTMEVWYRRWTSPGSDNQAGYDMWNRLWAEGRGKTAVAARDWHGPEQESPFPGDLPLTGIFADDASVAGLLAGMRRGAVIMSRGPIVDLEVVNGARRGGIGDRVAIGGLGHAGLRVRIDRLAQPAELRVYRSGVAGERRTIAADTVLDLELDGPGYYRAELWANDEPVTITNHVVAVADDAG
jgi:hypothetical protein